MVVGIGFYGGEAAKVRIYSEEEMGVSGEGEEKSNLKKRFPFINRVENGSRGWFL
jgi:hypothetical protein